MDLPVADAPPSSSASAAGLTSTPPPDPPAVPNKNTLNEDWKRKLLARQRGFLKNPANETQQDPQPQPMMEPSTQPDTQDDDTPNELSATMMQLKSKMEVFRKTIAKKMALDQDVAVDEIKLQQMQDELDTTIKKANIDLRATNDDLDQDLFVSDTEGHGRSGRRERHNVDFEASAAEAIVSYLNNPDKDVSGGAAENQQLGLKLKKSRKTKTPGQKAEKAGPSKGRTKVQKPKKMSKREEAAQRRANNLFNPAGLLAGGSQLFRDIQGNNARTAQPTFNAKKKQDALKQLVASIPAEQQELAKIDRGQLKAALKVFTPSISVQPDGINDGWKMKGMKSTLSHYQMLGASFMRSREVAEKGPKGGILADSMGLGKTVMMLANIVNGYRKNDHQMTLLVVPASLVDQWEHELIRHCQEGACGIHVRYHAGSKFKGPTESVVRQLGQFNMILTTYEEVRSSYPKWQPPATLTTAEAKAAWWNEYFKDNRGALHSIEFHRIVLDEAQAIKTVDSQTSVACRSLEGTYRWAMSGTPVLNRLEEFYPYFRFLKASGTGSLRVFKENFCSTAEGAERLNLYLRQFMIRRTHNDSLLGSKLLALEKPVKHDHKCHFSDVESEIYKIVKVRFVDRINGFSRAKELNKKYSNILTMLLRLRQITCHPLLVQDSLRDLLLPEDIQKLKELCNRPVARHMQDAHILQHLKMMLKQEPHELSVLDHAPAKNLHEIVMEGESTHSSDNGAGDMEGSTSLSKFSDTTNRHGTQNDSDAALAIADLRVVADVRETECDDTDHAIDAMDVDAQTPAQDLEAEQEVYRPKGIFGTRNDYSAFADDLEATTRAGEIEIIIKCSRCKLTAIAPHKTSCGHITCNECLLLMTQEAEENGRRPRCMACGKEYRGHEKYLGSGAQQQAIKPADSRGSPTAEDADAVIARTLDQTQQKHPRISDTVDKWIDANGKMLPSAKTLAFTAQITNWLQEDHSVKIIVYTQFITMLKIMSRICEMEGWDYVSLHGAMSIDQRSKSIADFGKKKNIRIMLATLRTGGVGLNLTMASRVMLIDVWWNSALEDQAFARTYRRGQTKQTRLTRFIVEDSIDTQIVEMQQRKEHEIGQVVDNEARARRRVDIPELLSLFGPVKTDPHGHPFIMVDEVENNKRPPRHARPDDDELVERGDEA